MHRTPLILALTLLLVSPGLASAQCLLSNPSFEISGSGGPVFAAWNQFGSLGSSANATHGQVGARVSGPNSGAWGLSAFWQPLDALPGQQFNAGVCASHTATNPITGLSAAILNIEWRDAGGNLISYETYNVATSATPTGVVQQFSVTSGPARVGTVSTRILLGTLQAPGEPAPDVYFDQVTFEESTPVNQWGDFPGGNTLDFSGYTWRVKGPGYYGPGPNTFCDTPSCTWVDGSDRLHMTISNQGGTWSSTEVVLEDALGYGDYIFTTVGELDTLHPNAVLGLFLWEYRSCYDLANGWWGPYNEIDVEISRWGNPTADVGQFVAQPYDWPGNIERFPIAFTPGGLTSHAFRWLADRVEYRSWHGGPQDEAPGTLIHTWTYTGPHVPRPEQPRVHINLWYFDSAPGTHQEAILDAFTFIPACSGPHCDEILDAVPTTPALGGILTAAPSPFRSLTTVRFRLDAPGAVDLAVYDIAGRKVRTLERGVRDAGEHELAWDGNDANGGSVAAGIYLIRLQLPTRTETLRVVRLK